MRRADPRAPLARPGPSGFDGATNGLGFGQVPGLFQPVLFGGGGPRRVPSRPALALALILAVLLGGCSAANQALRADFVDFNGIVQFNQAQQMLLNLVRLHYREAPLFLQAGSLSAAYESRASASASLTKEPGYPRTTEFGIDYAFAAKPTITYTPIEGQGFTTQFMRPITPDTFALLVRSGWPVARLMELLVEKVAIGGEVIQNHPQAPTYPRFQALVATLRQAEAAGRLGLIEEQGGLVARAGAERFPIKAWEFRSLFDVMFAAAHNIETPAAYRDRVRPALGNGVLTVRANAERPLDALVWVEHDGYWYSIAHGDVQSKDTFALLLLLARIQATPSTAQPVLTLPVR